MSTKIGFLSLQPTSDGKGFVGAVLVTDDLGKPEEFRVTYPVRPTVLQQQLYGASLVPHIGVELAGKPLLAALREKPNLLLVDDFRFLPLYKAVGCPTCHIALLGDRLSIDEPDGNSSVARKVASSSGRFQPLSVNFPVEYSAEEGQGTQSLVSSHYASLDLLEPFERIGVAVKALSEQDERFR